VPRLKDETKAKAAYMIKNSVVKKFAKVGGMRVSSDFYDALNIQVGKLVIGACTKASQDKRGTIRPTDLES
jgi:hypothetical protein